MFDVVADLTAGSRATLAPAPAVVAAREPYRVSRFVPIAEENEGQELATRKRRPSSIHIPSPIVPTPSAAYTVSSRRFSLQFTPTSPSFNIAHRSTTMLIDDEEEEFDNEKRAMQNSAANARRGRSARDNMVRARWDGARVAPMTSVKVDSANNKSSTAEGAEEEADEQRPAFWALMRSVYPTIPYKPLLFAGLVVCLLSGAMTPIFSFLLSRLLFEVSTGAQDSSVINRFGGIVLGIAALDGLLIGLKYFLMETSGMSWVTKMRNTSLEKVLDQDKKWFDKSINS
ncbi:hypothetical protein BDQ12DRAFT_619274, partial [Crucibulum laeve]